MEQRPIAALARSTTILEALAHWADQAPGALAFSFLPDGDAQGPTLTFGALDEHARALAQRLRAEGATGERVLLLYPAGLDFLVAFFACLYAGAVAVPLYPPRASRRDSRVSDVARDAGAVIALTTADVRRGADKAIAQFPELAGLRWLATDDAAALPVPARADVLVPRTADEVAYLQYTSGSTRSPKGVMVTHGNLRAQVLDLDGPGHHPAGSVFVTWLPHFHDMGLVYALLTPVCLGLPCHLMPPAAFLQHPARWLQAISRHRATHSGAPNFAYELCATRVAADVRATLDLRSWQVAFCGAEPVRRATLAAFVERFTPCGFAATALSPAYGLAEATLKVTVNVLEAPGAVWLSGRGLARDRVVEVAPEAPDARAVVGCGGVETTEVAIVAPSTSTRCAADEIGEIWLHGPSVAAGYWQRPEESEATFGAHLATGADERRFLRTGDLGFMRAGELFITGRLKDLIIIRGRNHYPQDIEATVAASHPIFAGQRGAAFPVDVDDEERLVVVHEVDRHARDLDAAAVAAAVRQQVYDEHELALHALVLVKPNGVPRTTSGKVQRQASRRAFLDDSLPVVARWQEERAAAAAPAAPAAAPEQRTAEAIETFLATRLAAQLGGRPDDIDLDQPFSGLGLDSVKALELLGDLESWIGESLSPTLFWDYPTIAELARHLAAMGEEQPAGDAGA